MEEQLEALKNHSNIARENLQVNQRTLQLQQEAANKKLSEEELELLHLFRLVTAGDTTYEWYKDRIQ